MKCNGTPFTIEKILFSGGTRTRDRYISRPALNPLSYRGSCETFDTKRPTYWLKLGKVRAIGLPGILYGGMLILIVLFSDHCLSFKWIFPSFI